VKRPPDRVRSIFSVAAWLNFFACDTDDEHWYDGAARRRITETISWLQDRIESRFPGAGLSRLCSHLLLKARAATQLADDFARPLMPLRVLTVFLVVTLAIGVGAAFSAVCALTCPP
jgi:hypothetical protein